MFEAGELVYFVDHQNGQVRAAKIQGATIIQGHRLYWMRGHLGYFSMRNIIKTRREAEQRLRIKCE